MIMIIIITIIVIISIIVIFLMELYVYKYYLLHESECDMAKYFTSRLIYFQEPEASENKACLRVKYIARSL